MQNQQTDDPLLENDEATEKLGLKNRNTLAVWRCTNRYPDLKYIKVGRSVRYRLSDLEHWLETRTH